MEDYPDNSDGPVGMTVEGEGASGGAMTMAQGDTAVSTGSSSSSGVSWENIILWLLMVIGVLILISFLVVMCRIARVKRGQEARLSTTEDAIQKHDEEASTPPPTTSQSSNAAVCDQYNGIRRWTQAVAVFTAFVGFVISIVANTSCRLVNQLNGYDDGPLKSIGLWSVSYRGDEYDVCSDVYPLDFIMDSAYTASRAFGVIAAIIGGASLLFLLRSLFATPLSFVRGLRITGALSFISALCLGLTLLVFQSGNCRADVSGYDCNLEQGSGVFIPFGAAYWFLAGIALMILPAGSD